MNWISVVDQKTPKNKRFIGYGEPMCGNCDGKILEICKYDEDYDNVVFGEFDCSKDITHWMLLPEKPE
jgi:hypothetical protein